MNIDELRKYREEIVKQKQHIYVPIVFKGEISFGETKVIVDRIITSNLLEDNDDKKISQSVIEAFDPIALSEIDSNLTIKEYEQTIEKCVKEMSIPDDNEFDWDSLSVTQSFGFLIRKDYYDKFIMRFAVALNDCYYENEVRKKEITKGLSEYIESLINKGIINTQYIPLNLETIFADYANSRGETVLNDKYLGVVNIKEYLTALRKLGYDIEDNNEDVTTDYFVELLHSIKYGMIEPYTDSITTIIDFTKTLDDTKEQEERSTLKI